MVVLLLGWLVMTYLGVDAISNGDPHLLVNGIDYDGRICGIDDAVKDKPKVCYDNLAGPMRCVVLVVSSSADRTYLCSG